MARNALLLLAALVAQGCSAAPVVVPTFLPSSLSFTLSITATGIPLPTGAHLDIPHPPALPTGFPGIPRGEKEEENKRDEEFPHLPLPTGLPTGLPGIPRNEDFPHLPLPTGLPGIPKREEDFPHLPLPTGLPGIPRDVIGKEKIEPTFTASLGVSSAPPVPTGWIPGGPPHSRPTASGLSPAPTGPVPSGRPSGVPVPLGHAVPGGVIITDE